MPRGGSRIGAGRPRKDGALAALHGSRQRSSVGKAAPVKPLETVHAPADLSVEALDVWRELAPHAIAKRTLTAAHALAFRKLCENVVMERAIAASIASDGMTSIRVTTDVTSGEQHIEKKAHALFPRHTAMLVRVETGLRAFGLGPTGKEVADDAPPVDPFAEFDGPAGVQ